MFGKTWKTSENKPTSCIKKMLKYRQVGWKSLRAEPLKGLANRLQYALQTQLQVTTNC
jgi:hypothetical protein